MKIINYLSLRPKINFVLLIAYLLLVILTHEIVGEMTVPIRKKLGLENYNLLVTCISFLGLMLYFLPLYIASKKNEIQTKIFSYLLINCTLAVICFKVLFVLNIEAIHFVQYGIFAILCFPLVRNYLQTIGITMWAGAVDEAYQYVYLSPLKTEYFDFNDVIINTVGAGFGLILIRAFAQWEKKWKMVKSPFFIISVFMLGTFGVAYFTGFLSIHPNDQAHFSLIRITQPGFWSIVHPSIKFHVVKPLEGVIVVAGLLVFYKTLNSRIYKNDIPNLTP